MTVSVNFILTESRIIWEMALQLCPEVGIILIIMLIEVGDPHTVGGTIPKASGPQLGKKAG